MSGFNLNWCFSECLVRDMPSVSVPNNKMSLPEIMASLQLTDNSKPEIKEIETKLNNSSPQEKDLNCPSVEKSQLASPRVRTNLITHIEKRRFKRKPVKHDALKHVETMNRYGFGGYNALRVNITKMETILECPEEGTQARRRHDFVKNLEKIAKREIKRTPRVTKNKNANFEHLLARLKELVE